MVDWIKRIDVPPAMRPAFEQRPRLVGREIWRNLEVTEDYTTQIRASIAEEVKNARETASQIFENARREGETAGMARFLEAVQNLDAAQRRREECAAPDAVELTLAILARVLQSAAREHEDLLKALTWQAIQAAQGRGAVNLLVNPEQVKDISRHISSWSEILGQPVTLQPDPALEPGECVVQTRHGEIDGRLGTIVAGFERALRGQP